MRSSVVAASAVPELLPLLVVLVGGAAAIGHVSTPGRRARAHSVDADHPPAVSVEPGERWAHCFVDGEAIAGSAPPPGWPVAG